ncbi:hypothetical protein [Amycolatopsis sp. cmx-4-83]|uniref:hypothetical protein n=1 Tax=Amycolatopsis sp. cmx-4-83 TaxID=2790940 RepID=UPI00397B79BE
MTVSILASRGLGGDQVSRSVPIVVLGQPHARRKAPQWFEPLLVALSLVLFARLRGGGRHAGTRVTSSSLGRVRRFVRDWWVLFAVFGGFALVTVVGVLVLSVQVPR